MLREFSNHNRRLAIDGEDAQRPRLSRHGQNEVETKNAFEPASALERSRWPWSAEGRLLGGWEAIELVH